MVKRQLSFVFLQLLRFGQCNVITTMCLCNVGFVWSCMHKQSPFNLGKTFFWNFHRNNGVLYFLDGLFCPRRILV